MAQTTFRWGILGTARIARTMFVPELKAANAGEVVAVASRDLERARSVAAELDIPRAYGSYEELLADPDVEGVYIGLPNNLHAEWTIAAARAGKHVLCEKPIARRAAEAERMANACNSAGVVLIEAFMWRHHPQHARVRALIQEGAIGEPTLVRSSFSFVIEPAGNIRLRADLEGGSLMDIGCYPVNLARWIFESEPIACIGQQVADPAYGVDVSFAGVLRFDSDRLAVFDNSFRHAFINRYEVVGTEGRISVPRAYRPDTQPGLIQVIGQGTEKTEEVPAAKQYALEAEHFARCARAGRLLPPAENGVAQARAIEALYASAETGSAVRLPRLPLSSRAAPAC